MHQIDTIRGMIRLKKSRDHTSRARLFHIEVIHGFPQEVLESVGSQRFITLSRDTIKRSVLEELGTSESEQSHILQDFPEGVDIVVAAPAFVAVQHVADGVIHGEPPPSASSTEPGC